MSTFINALLGNAYGELKCVETPPGSNRSKCIDDIKRLVFGRTDNEAWCASFVSYIFKITLNQFKKPIDFVQTASTSEILNWGKKRIIVDRSPAVGSIMYKTREGGGHVGIVSRVSGKNFTTIDGNSGDRVQENVRNVESNMQFIHTEKYYNYGAFAALAVNPGVSLSSLLLLAAGGYGIYRYRGGKKLFWGKI